MDAPQDLDTAHPVTDEPAPLVKVQRWYHLRRLFVFDFGWHTKDFRLISITETEPGEFSCTFKPRYFPYRMFLPILLGRPETMPPHCLNRMISRCLYAIMRDRCRLPARTWGIAINFKMSFARPIRIGPNRRMTIQISLTKHTRTHKYDGFAFRCRTDDGHAEAMGRYGLLDEPGHAETKTRAASDPLPTIDSTGCEREYPLQFTRSWIRRHSMFELNHGWQLKEYRPKYFEQTDRTRYIISFRPRYRFIRRLAPLFLRRPERMAIDCSIRMLERSLAPVLQLSGRSSGSAVHRITDVKMHCREPITVRAGRLVPLHLELVAPEPGEPETGFHLRFSLGNDTAFEGSLRGTAE